MNVKQSFLVLVVAVTANFAHGVSPVSTTFFGNLAVEGYDVIGYFTEGAAVKGSKKHQWEWMGAKWRFSSAENLALFKNDPEKYAPQYGGYCAWAVSNGKTAGIDPEQFAIVDGKLYLNFNKSIQEKWTAERDERIRLADEEWPDLVD